MFDHGDVMPNGCFIIPITQEEIAKDLGLSLKSTSAIFTKLQNMKMISRFDGHKGRYIMSKEVYELIKGMATVEDKIVK